MEELRWLREEPKSQAFFLFSFFFLSFFFPLRFVFVV